MKILLRALARGPGVSAAGGGGAGEGERSSVVAAIVLEGTSGCSRESSNLRM